VLLADKEVAFILAPKYVQVTLHIGQYAGSKDKETPGGAEYLKKVARHPVGAPFYVFLNGRGDLVADAFYTRGDRQLVNLGYPLEPTEIKQFVGLIKATSNVTDSECSTLQSRLSALARRWQSGRG
jgi:hypothetical protein